MADIKKGDHKFYIGDEQDPKAEITYQDIDANTLNVDHTYVSEELRGEGIGGKLVEKMVNFAQDEGKKIDPTCPYAKKKIEETSAYRDVLA
ncbi:GNAT family N-acetyltransferase [Lentibacillus amyloliquefaciens]|uniref:Acetyltransferase n=1 Tax=Lentibacillus amyloliquefaciens TaxID=1472767 RepID=A0A0U4E843_9BACI|nr:GNAT family N-acetyltransferase [Lentibacillus amyloliquefaciens]ALX49025.1 acetyltransferase [Lentibacillus amyloliquefaciens]